MPIMLNYAFDAHPFLRDATIMLNYANYALCSNSAIMPKSNAGIIGLAQGSYNVFRLRLAACMARATGVAAAASRIVCMFALRLYIRKIPLVAVAWQLANLRT